VEDLDPLQAHVGDSGDKMVHTELLHSADEANFDPAFALMQQWKKISCQLLHERLIHDLRNFLRCTDFQGIVCWFRGTTLPQQKMSVGSHRSLVRKINTLVSESLVKMSPGLGL
jgi:hypothetical protein